MTGRTLRTIRRKLGLNQTEFGKLLGYVDPQVQISKIETGKRKINKRLEKLVRMIEQQQNPYPLAK